MDKPHVLLLLEVVIVIQNCGSSDEDVLICGLKVLFDVMSKITHWFVRVDEGGNIVGCRHVKGVGVGVVGRDGGRGRVDHVL